jgi:hypothetical protein
MESNKLKYFKKYLNYKIKYLNLKGGVNKPIYKLRDWIDINNLNWKELSLNPHSAIIQIFQDNIDNIDIENLSYNSNPQMIELFDLVNAKDNYPEQYFVYLSLSNDDNLELIEDELNNNPDNEFIPWGFLTENKNNKAIQLLEKYKDKIGWHYLSGNENTKAIKLTEAILEMNPDSLDINWYLLSKNSNAMRILKKYQNKINWYYLCLNENKEAIQMIENELEINPNDNKIIWGNLSQNSQAIHLLKKYQNKIDWKYICANINPEAIEMIEEFLNKNSNHTLLNWKLLSRNPSAIKLLERYRDNIFWDKLSTNPAIFEFDTQAMRRNFQPLEDEIMAASLHPDRINQTADDLLSDEWNIKNNTR